jgi:hypothetical protein
VTSIELHACCARRRITHHYAQGMVEKIQIAKTIRYVLLQKSILIPYEFLQFPQSGRNFGDSFFDNWLVFSLGQQRDQPGEESLGRTGLQENAAGAGQVNDQPFTAQQG